MQTLDREESATSEDFLASRVYYAGFLPSQHKPEQIPPGSWPAFQAVDPKYPDQIGHKLVEQPDDKLRCQSVVYVTGTDVVLQSGSELQVLWRPGNEFFNFLPAKWINLIDEKEKHRNRSSPALLLHFGKEEWQGMLTDGPLDPQSKGKSRVDVSAKTSRKGQPDIFTQDGQGRVLCFDLDRLLLFDSFEAFGRRRDGAVHAIMPFDDGSILNVNQPPWTEADTKKFGTTERPQVLWSLGEDPNSGLDWAWTSREGNSQTFFSNKPDALDGFKSRMHMRCVGGGGFFILYLCELSCHGDPGYSEPHQVWSLGDNRFSQLGREACATSLASTAGSTEDLHVRPIDFFSPSEGFPDRIRKVAAGARHAAALTCAGNLYLWGWNGEGQLGLGREAPSVVDGPMLWRAPEFYHNHDVTVSDVDCGSDHTVIVLDDGSVWSTGSDQYGQLGLGVPSGSSARQPCSTKQSYTSKWMNAPGFPPRRTTKGASNSPWQVKCGPWGTFVILESAVSDL